MHSWKVTHLSHRREETMGTPRRRWVDNIRMNLQEVGCGYIDWIGLAQDRDRWRTLVSAVMNFRVPWNAGNLLTSYKPVSFSRRTLHDGVSKQVSIRISETIFTTSMIMIVKSLTMYFFGGHLTMHKPSHIRRERHETRNSRTLQIPAFSTHTAQTLSI